MPPLLTTAFISLGNYHPRVGTVKYGESEATFILVRTDRSPPLLRFSPGWHMSTIYYNPSLQSPLKVLLGDGCLELDVFLPLLGLFLLKDLEHWKWFQFGTLKMVALDGFGTLNKRNNSFEMLKSSIATLFIAMICAAAFSSCVFPLKTFDWNVESHTSDSWYKVITWSWKWQCKYLGLSFFWVPICHVDMFWGICLIPPQWN